MTTGNISLALTNCDTFFLRHSKMACATVKQVVGWSVGFVALVTFIACLASSFARIEGMIYQLVYLITENLAPYSLVCFHC